MRIGAGIFLLACLLNASYSAASDLPVNKETFCFDNAPTVVRLKHGNIIRNTLVVTANGRTLSDDEYDVDVPTGTIQFLTSLPIPVSIEIAYSHLWFQLPSYYFKRKLTNTEARPPSYGAPLDLSPVHGRSQTEHSNKLQIFGSKSIGFRAGTGADLELNQTLNVQIDGYLSDNLKVSGVLSDQSSPDVGGISTSLGEIDRVTLSLASDNFRADIGDIVFDRKFGMTSRLTKTLKGGQVAVHSGNLQSDLTVGGIKSKHGALRSFGRDGIAGPYKLLSNAGRYTVSILPGTDRVWLDGRALVRGADADYQVDYLRGELTFSPRITITSRSRIEADFEYLDENYRQDFYAGSFLLGDTASFASARIDFLRQSDSKDNPSQLALSPGDIELLADAGDSSTLAARSGVAKVDSGQGSYLQEIIESDTVYSFVGLGNGDYQVSFSYYGEGKGDYRYLGGGVYEFIARGKGSYLPVVFVPLPERADAVSLTTQTGNDAVSFRFIGTVSDHDRNLASNIGDNDNTGSDMGASLSVSPFGRPDAAAVTWEATVEARRSESEFFLPGRKYDVERDREWGLRSDSIFNVLEQVSISQMIHAASYGSLAASFGLYQDRDFIDANRYGYVGTLSPFNHLAVTVSRSDRKSTDIVADMDSRLYEDEIAVRLDGGMIRAFGRWNDETDLRPLDSTDSGRRYDRYTTGAGFAGASLDVAYENRELRREEWQKEYDSRDVSFAYTSRGGVSESSVIASITHRRVHYFIPNQYNQSQLATSLDYRLGGFGNLFDLSLNYRISREGVERTSESFIKVGEGEGEFRHEDGVYVPDPFGDYIRVEEVLGTDDVGISISRSLILYTRPEHWKSCPASLAFLKRFTLETHLRTSENGGENERFNAGWIVPYAGVFEDTRRNYGKNLRQTTRVDLGRGMSVFSSFEEQRTARPMQTPQLADYGLTLLNRLEFDFKKVVLYTIEHRFKRLDQNSRSYGDASFVEHRLGNVLRYRPDPRYELVLKPAYLRDMSRSDDLEVTMWEAAAEASRQIAGTGRVSGRFAYQSVSASQTERFIPFQYVSGRRLGDNLQWGATVELRFSRSISTSLSYDGEKIPEIDTRHVSSVSVKARF